MSEKRSPESGASPGQKKFGQIVDSKDKDEAENEGKFSSQTSSTLPPVSPLHFDVSPSSPISICPVSQTLYNLSLSAETSSLPRLGNPSPLPSPEDDDINSSSDSFSSDPFPFLEDNCSDLGSDLIYNETTADELSAALVTSIEELGTEKTSEIILANKDLKQMIIQTVLSSAHNQMKTALKESRLTADKKYRGYLLTLTPRSLCAEMQEMSSETFCILASSGCNLYQ